MTQDIKQRVAEVLEALEKMSDKPSSFKNTAIICQGYTYLRENYMQMASLIKDLNEREEKLVAMLKGYINDDTYVDAACSWHDEFVNLLKELGINPTNGDV
jgi:hypothetical protein